MTKPDIERAVKLLRSGELVAFPTETVYGLGADALNRGALAKIFAVKGRPPDHPLIIHLPPNPTLEMWARDVPRAAVRLAQTFWPGPLTMILKRNPRVPDEVTGGQNTVGLRVPNHPVAIDLLSHFGGGVAAPSANRFGRISPTTAPHVRQELGDAVPLILDGGACPIGIESTIVDLSRGQPVLLRPGAIAAAEIAEVLSLEQLAENDVETAPRVSGQLPRHYSPRTPLRVVPGEALDAEVRARIAQGLRTAVLARDARLVANPLVLWQRTLTDPAGYAHDLYAHLRDLDAEKVDLILVEAPPAEEAWLAISDRLNRASSGSSEDET